MFSKTFFSNRTGVSSRLDPDQVRRFLEPDLGPNCLQRLSADDTSRQRVRLATSLINNSLIFFCKNKKCLAFLIASLPFADLGLNCLG